MKPKFILPLLAAVVLAACMFTSCNEDYDNPRMKASPEDALMLNNFIWDGMEPTVTRNSTGEDFPEIKFLVRFQNDALPHTDRKYDIGVALYDAANRCVRKFPLYEKVALRVDKEYKMDDKIVVPNDIADGKYLLKPICRLSGTVKWQDFNQADDYALGVTISGNEVQLKQNESELFDFTVDNIADVEEDILEDNSLKGTFIVKNFDDKVLSKDIYMMLITIDMNDFSLKMDSEFEHPEQHQLMQLSTPAYGEEQVSFEFSGLDYDSYYALTYGIKDENGEFQDISGGDFFIIYTTASAPE